MAASHSIRCTAVRAGRYAVASGPDAVQRTRSEVRAEAVYAIRNGLTVGGEV